VRYTAQAFQQMRPARRRVVLLATLRELEATLTDAAIDMFIALVGRAHLRARKRLEQRVAVSGREGRERMLRIARVLEAVSHAARAGGDVAAAVGVVASLDIIDADAAIIRRTASLTGTRFWMRSQWNIAPSSEWVLCSCALSISKAAPGCRRCARRWRSSPISTGTGAGRCPTMCQQAISSAAGVAMS
jgi:hypothetical protein